MYRPVLVCLIVCMSASAWALSLSDLSNTDATGGLKDALVQSIGAAVGKLGITDGFLKNPQVKIPLPDSLKKAEKAMRMFGMGKQADSLVEKMNHAAEDAAMRDTQLSHRTQQCGTPNFRTGYSLRKQCGTPNFKEAMRDTQLSHRPTFAPDIP